MICPNLRIGAPSPTGTTAILWPLGTRSRALDAASRRSAGGNIVNGDNHVVGGIEAKSARSCHDCRLPGLG